MKTITWVKICLLNLLLIALIGVLMRYKIVFEFPYLNQKNLQHAHSHFAFGGWVSLIIMVLIIDSIKTQIKHDYIKSYNSIFKIQLAASYGMLISFSIQGYGVFSIIFSTISLLLSFVFSWKFFLTTKEIRDFTGKKWISYALFFNIFSSLGTIILSYMMATKQLDQQVYLSSVYWYLHFQYNGWFFFACIGLFLNYLKTQSIIFTNEKSILNLFAVSCIPAYGLSVLWLDIHFAIYIAIIIAALLQFYALILLINQMIKNKLFTRLNLDFLSRILLLFFTIAIAIKFTLQLGSVIPSLSKFAFGFRPVVIAYLHLVLLAFTSVFLVSYAYFKEYIAQSLSTKIGIILFLTGILLNELILAIQGIASISYTLIPYANESLFAVSVLISVGLLTLNISNYFRR